MYNLGLILKTQGKYAEAMDTLYRATWNFAYNSPANHQLAQMYSQVKDYQNALIRLDEAIQNNGNNWNAVNLKASILRVEGRQAEAKALLEGILAVDPLNIYTTYELDKLNGTSEYVTLMGGEIEDYLELAILYLHNGFKDEAVKILKEADALKAYPSVKMWLGYLTGDKAMYEAALAMPVDYCNPFRLETIPVLEKAKELFPESDKPYYYLGCLLYNKQQDAAAYEPPCQVPRIWNHQRHDLERLCPFSVSLGA
jgi:tetratricopeptide (TPR) repeat protein